MELNLAAFLSGHKALVEDSAVWGDLPLRITSYLSNELPPSQYITSVRGIIFHNDSILVVRNPQGIHISPGGQREAGETLEETLHREVLEETGWTITEVRMLGFVHFHHLKTHKTSPFFKFLARTTGIDEIDGPPDARHPHHVSFFTNPAGQRRGSDFPTATPPSLRPVFAIR